MGRLIFFLALLPLPYSLPLWSQPDPQDAPGQNRVRQLDYEALVEQWQARQKSLFPEKTGAFGRADLIFRSALRDQGVSGLMGMPQATEMAHAAIANSQRFLKADKKELAQQEAKLALLLAPQLPSAYTNFAVLESQSSSVVDTARAYLKWAQMMWTYPDTKVSIIARGVSALLASLITFLLILAGLYLVRSLRLITFDLQNITPIKIARWQLWGISIAVLAIPLLLSFGPLWTALTWLTFAFLYINPRERALVVVFALLAIAVPSAQYFASGFWTHTDSRFDTAIRGYRDLADHQARAKIAGRASADRTLFEDATLAHHAFREGRIADARTLYTSMNAKNPAPWLANNLGISLAVLGEEQKALALFMNAAEEGLDEAFFNASLVHVRNGRTSKGAELSSMVDPEKVESFRAITFTEGQGNAVHNARYVFAGADIPVVKTIASEQSKESKRFTDEIMTLLTRGLTPTRALVLGALILVFWLMLRFISPRLQPSTPCRKCGQPSSRRYDGPDVPVAICSTCDRVFGRSNLSMADFGIKARKEGQIIDFQAATRRMGRVLSIVLPGLGHLYARAPVAGTAITLCALTILWALFFFVGPIPYAEIEGSAGKIWIRLFGAGLYVALGLYSFTRVGAWLGKGGR